VKTELGPTPSFVLETGSRTEPRAPKSNMNLKKLFLLLTIVFLTIGLGTMFMGHSKSSTMAMIEGITKGLAGVFFILYYIFMLFEKERMDKPSSH
jgi:hypothetical protein